MLNAKFNDTQITAVYSRKILITPITDLYQQKKYRQLKIRFIQ